MIKIKTVCKTGGENKALQTDGEIWKRHRGGILERSVRLCCRVTFDRGLQEVKEGAMLVLRRESRQRGQQEQRP